MVHTRRYLPLLVGLLGCTSSTEAGLALALRTDMSVPVDIDSVRIQVMHRERGEIARTELQLTGSGRMVLPGVHTFSPSQSKLTGPFTIRVLGLLRGVPKTLREAVADIPRTYVGALDMPLEFLCYEKVKTLDDGTVLGTCGDGLTCMAGECKPVPTFVGADMPTYRPSTGTGGCYDVERCFAGASTLTVDTATCTAPKPAAGAGLTLGILAPAPAPGVVFRSGKLGVLDPGGWQELGAQLQLSNAACSALRQTPGAKLLAATTCAGKTAEAMLCPAQVDASVPQPDTEPPSDTNAPSPDTLGPATDAEDATIDLGTADVADSGRWEPRFDAADGGTDVAPETIVVIPDATCGGTTGESCPCTEGATISCAEAFGALGNCAKGTSTCKGGAWQPCSVTAKPTDDCAKGADDSNCNGTARDGCICVPGAASTCALALGAKGACAAGTAICNATGTQWTCDVTPKPDSCEPDNDDNCDGYVNNPAGGCLCLGNATSTCLKALGLAGACAAGTTQCVNGKWGPCSILPTTDTCDATNDNDCNGALHSPPEDCICINGTTRACGGCNDGTSTCVGGRWAACVGATSPTIYYLDADLDGYGDPNTPSQSVCKAPAGYVTNKLDCCDKDKNARPGQTAYYSTANACGKYDYDCDGRESQQSNGPTGCYESNAGCVLSADQTVCNLSPAPPTQCNGALTSYGVGPCGGQWIVSARGCAVYCTPGGCGCTGWSNGGPGSTKQACR